MQALLRDDIIRLKSRNGHQMQKLQQAIPLIIIFVEKINKPPPPPKNLRA